MVDHRRILGDGQHHPDGVGGGLGVGELAQRHHLGTGLLDPVAAGDPQVEVALGHVPGDLLGPQDADLVDAWIVDGGPVVDVRSPHHGEVGRGEEIQRRLFERALGQDQSQHGRPRRSVQRAGSAAGPGSLRSRSAISSAVTAASYPLLASPAAQRARACSTVSVVSTPKTTGTPVSRAARCSPDGALAGHEVEVRGLAPDDRTEGHDGVARLPTPARRMAARGISKAPGTQATVTVAALMPLGFETRERSFEQSFGDPAVELGAHERHPGLARPTSPTWDVPTRRAAVSMAWDESAVASEPSSSTSSSRPSMK